MFENLPNDGNCRRESSSNLGLVIWGVMSHGVIVRDQHKPLQRLCRELCGVAATGNSPRCLADLTNQLASTQVSCVLLFLVYYVKIEVVMLCRGASIFYFLYI